MRPIIITYYGAKLDRNKTLMENGLVPGWENPILINNKAEMVIDAECECALIEQKESDRVYANRLPNVLKEELSRALMDQQKIKSILKEIINIAIPANVLTSVVNKLRKLTEKIKLYQG